MSTGDFSLDVFAREVARGEEKFIFLVAEQGVCIGFVLGKVARMLVHDCYYTNQIADVS